MELRQSRLLVAILVTAILCIVVMTIQFQLNDAPIELPTVRELVNCELLIENAACEDGEYQIVDDAAFQKNIAQLCKGMEPFRPYVSEFDTILGVSDFIPYIYFTDGNVRYCFVFSGVYEQMQREYL